MNLVYICRNCNLSGGQSKIAWELARRASIDHHDVHIVARRFPPDENPETHGIINNHRVFQWPRFLGQWRFRSFAYLSSRRARRLCNRGVVHGFGDSYHQDILTLGNVDWNYKKYIPNRGLNRTAISLKTKALIDPNLKILVLVSHQMKNDLLELYPDYDLSKVRYIYPGVDIVRFSPSYREKVRRDIATRFGIPANAMWLVSGAGGDFDKRNVDGIGKALLKLAHRSDWVFLFIGGTAESVDWPKELKSRSYFLGHIDDISTVLPGCDLMVYPAWYDESPLFCLEGMASGLPFVISRTVGTSEVMSPLNKARGILDDPGDIIKLAQLIGQQMDNPELRINMGIENHKAVQGFSWDATYLRYKNLYEEVASSFKKN